MTDNTKELDIAQRIAEYLARTSEPKASANGSKKENGEVIGSVPVHLRHLHNLFVELGDEAAAAEREFHTKKERMMMVRSIFFDALKTQVPGPENCSGFTLLENWDVVANYGSDDEMGGALGELLAAMGGRR
jgi:hypothetical protein